MESTETVVNEQREPQRIVMRPAVAQEVEVESTEAPVRQRMRWDPFSGKMLTPEQRAKLAYPLPHKKIYESWSTDEKRAFCAKYKIPFNPSNTKKAPPVTKAQTQQTQTKPQGVASVVSADSIMQARQLAIEAVQEMGRDIAVLPTEAFGKTLELLERKFLKALSK